LGSLTLNTSHHDAYMYLDRCTPTGGRVKSATCQVNSFANRRRGVVLTYTAVSNASFSLGLLATLRCIHSALLVNVTGSLFAVIRAAAQRSCLKSGLTTNTRSDGLRRSAPPPQTMGRPPCHLSAPLRGSAPARAGHGLRPIPRGGGTPGADPSLHIGQHPPKPSPAQFVPFYVPKQLTAYRITGRTYRYFGLGPLLSFVHLCFIYESPFPCKAVV